MPRHEGLELASRCGPEYELLPIPALQFIDSIYLSTLDSVDPYG